MRGIKVGFDNLTNALSIIGKDEESAVLRLRTFRKRTWMKLYTYR